MKEAEACNMRTIRVSLSKRWHKDGMSLDDVCVFVCVSPLLFLLSRVLAPQRECLSVNLSMCLLCCISVDEVDKNGRQERQKRRRETARRGEERCK